MTTDARNSMTGTPDASEPSPRGRASEVIRGATVEVLEVRPGRHRMHQIVGTTHTGQRAVERRLVEAITGDNFSGQLDWRNLLSLPGQATNGVAAVFKESKKAAADVSRSASEQNAHVNCSPADSSVGKTTASARYRPRGRTRKPPLLIGARPCTWCERSDWSGHAGGRIGSIWSCRSVPPAGPLTAQTVGFEPARSEPNPSAGIRAAGRRALFCSSGPGADQARGARRQALSILPLPTCGLCRPLRWRLLRYGPWCFATILRWVVGTGGLLVDAVVSEA